MGAFLNHTNRYRFGLAAEIVRERGWWRGPSNPNPLGSTMERGPAGEVCIATAVMDAFPSDQAAEALAHLKAVIGLPDTPGSLGDWNDAPERTLWDVRQALRRCADA